MSEFADTGKGIFQVFHILNNFDIPVGVARSIEDGKIFSDYTMLTVARDPQNIRFYYNTYNDQILRMVDLKKLDLDAKKNPPTQHQKRATCDRYIQQA